MGYCGAINVSLPAAHINSHIWSEMKKKGNNNNNRKTTLSDDKNLKKKINKLKLKKRKQTDKQNVRLI